MECWGLKPSLSHARQLSYLLYVCLWLLVIYFWWKRGPDFSNSGHYTWGFSYFTLPLESHPLLLFFFLRGDLLSKLKATPSEVYSTWPAGLMLGSKGTELLRLFDAGIMWAIRNPCIRDIHQCYNGTRIHTGPWWRQDIGSWMLYYFSSPHFSSLKKFLGGNIYNLYIPQNKWTDNYNLRIFYPEKR